MKRYYFALLAVALSLGTAVADDRCPGGRCPIQESAQTIQPAVATVSIVQAPFVGRRPEPVYQPVVTASFVAPVTPVYVQSAPCPAPVVYSAPQRVTTCERPAFRSRLLAFRFVRSKCK